jgi:hypothetical protein
VLAFSLNSVEFVLYWSTRACLEIIYAPWRVVGRMNDREAFFLSEREEGRLRIP